MDKMLESVLFDNVKVTGIAGEYVFESIKKRQNYYEMDLLEKWTTYISSARCILDIGANLGNHTIYWGKHTHAEKIYSFEPYGVNFELLNNNVKNNSLGNVITVNKGVGEKCGYTSIENFDESNYGATTLSSNVTTEGEIEIIDIDSFCSEVGMETVDFVKIDTEGYEEKVLAGMRTTLKKWHPDLWIEVSRQTVRNVINQMKDFGYILAALGGCNCLFLYQERHPEIKEMSNTDIQEMMLDNLERANKYYRNYETAKRWHQNSLDKNEQLKKKLEETEIACTEARSLLTVKEEECRLGEEKYRQQGEILADLKDLGKQREVLISEYVAWNEQNKSKIEELEQNIIGFQSECKAAERKLDEAKREYEQKSIEYKENLELQKKEYETLLVVVQEERELKESYFSELESVRNNLAEEQGKLEDKIAEIQKLQLVIDSEKAQKEKCVEELQACLAELEEKKKILEELKRCKEEISELQVKMEGNNAVQQKLKTELFACVGELQEQEVFLSELRQYIRKLETQNKYLASENAECRRKLSIITDTKLGQICLKAYHLLKRIYRKLFRK